MRLRHVVATVACTALGLLLLGCTQAQPTPAQPPAPTKAAAAPAQAAVAPTTAPTQAPAKPTTAPTAVPVVYPEKGKPVTYIVGWAAGAGADTAARTLAAGMEKVLGIPIQVVNKEGASSQVGLTEMAKAKPDGYTWADASLPTAIITYADATTKAVYGRKDLAPIANQIFDPNGFAVRADLPFKDVKELVDYAKANPGKLTIGTAGRLTSGHLPGLMLEKLTGAKFNYVHFAGNAPAITAMLGGNVDINVNTATSILSQVKAGGVRMLGVMTREEMAAYPGIKTLAAQGYPVEFGITRGIVAPAGVPQPVLQILSDAVKKAMETDEWKQRIGQIGSYPRFMDVQEYTKYWDDTETTVKPLIELAKAEVK